MFGRLREVRLYNLNPCLTYWIVILNTSSVAGVPKRQLLSLRPKKSNFQTSGNINLDLLFMIQNISSVDVFFCLLILSPILTDNYSSINLTLLRATVNFTP